MLKSAVHLIDCVEFMRGCADNAFDLAVVDPPYGININHSMGRRKGDKKSNYKKADWDNEPPPLEYFYELFRVSKNQIIWGANHFISRMPYDSASWLMWDKKFSDEVTFSQYEMAWTSLDGTCKKFDKHPTQENRIHPTQKPIQLYDWILHNYAKPNDTILDTHMGSQSSRIACHKAGLNFTGCELDPEYFQQGNERYELFIKTYGTPDPTTAIQGQQINLF